MNLMNCLPSVQQLVLAQARQRSGAGTTNFTGVDVSALEGQGVCLLDVKYESGTGATLDCKLQESDTLGGTYTDVAGGAFAQAGVADSVQKIPVDLAQLKKFVRAVGVEAGTSPVYAYQITLLGFKKYN